MSYTTTSPHSQDFLAKNATRNKPVQEPLPPFASVPRRSRLIVFKNHIFQLVVVGADNAESDAVDVNQARINGKAHIFKRSPLSVFIVKLKIREPNAVKTDTVVLQVKTLNRFGLFAFEVRTLTICRFSG